VTLRLAFWGTPDFEVPTIAEMIATGHDIAASIPAAPAPRARHGRWSRARSTNSPSRGLAVRTPAVLKEKRSRRRSRRWRWMPPLWWSMGLMMPSPFWKPPCWFVSTARLALAALARRRPHPARVWPVEPRNGVMVSALEEGLDHRPRC